MLPVIMTVLNNEKDIGTCLESLSRQTVNIKLFVVDGGSKDRTIEIIKKYKNDLSIDLMIKKVNRSVARNLAIRKTKVDLFGVVNSDVDLEENCFEELMKVIKKRKDVGGVAGTQIKPRKQNWIARGIFYMPGMAQISERMKFDNGLVETHSVPCECGILRRKAFDDARCFDEKLNWGEDVELGMRMRKEGWKLFGVEKARFEHFYKDSLGGFWKQQVGYGSGGGLMWRRGLDLDFAGLKWKKWVSLTSPVLIAFYLFLLAAHPLYFFVLTTAFIIALLTMSGFRISTTFLLLVKIMANIFGVWKGVFQESQGVQT